MTITREEAIAMLKSKMDGNVDTSYEWAETVRMAIEALQAKTDGDLISREDAIRTIDLVDYRGYSIDMVRKITDLCIDAINELPSADTDRPQGKWIQQYIGRDAIPHKRCNQCNAVIEESFFGYVYDVNFCPQCGADMRGKEDD